MDGGQKVRCSILKKFAPEDRKALDGKGAGRTEKGGKPHCFRGVKGGLTANSPGSGVGSQQALAGRQTG